MSGRPTADATVDLRCEHLRGDGPCDDCGGLNVVWFTDDLLWNRVVRDHDTERILCMHCFIARAETYYEVTGWKLSIAPLMIDRVTP